MTGRMPGFGVFGCSLDALDAHEKVEMKLAYMDAVTKGVVPADIARDPYDLLVGGLAGAGGARALGKMMLESWVTPRPDPTDTGMVSALEYRDFLGSEGCGAVCERLAGFVREKVLPLRPVLIGVDHSLTGGVLEPLAEGFGPGGLGLVVLDSHFDAISAAVRKNAGLGQSCAPGLANAGAPASPSINDLPEGNTCGNWLAGLIERGVVNPGNVVVIGPSDHPGYEGAPDEDTGLRVYRRAYIQLEDKGVTVVPKRTIRHRGLAEAVKPALESLDCRAVYLSIDADVAAGEQVKAVRFLDTIGLSVDELAELFAVLGGWLSSTGLVLAGIDLVEIDVHLADIPDSGDMTLEVFSGHIRNLMESF